MTKLKLNPDPTFNAKVAIPVPGGDPVDVEFTFKHRTRDELEKFIDSNVNRNEVETDKDVKTILDMASGWELSDAFTADNVRTLVQNYITAPRAIYETYIDELVKARRKN